MSKKFFLFVPVFVFASCLDEFAEQRTCFIWSALEFRVELATNHPRMIWNLYCFNQISFWIYTRNNKACVF